MRIFIALMLGLMMAIPAIARDPTDGPYTDTDIYQQSDTTRQENTSFNQPSSAMSNVQINPWGNARDYYGDGVSCSKPSVNVGLAGGEAPHRAVAYASVNIPLGTKDCKAVAATRKLTMEYELEQLKIEQRKADVLFAAKMAKMCLEMAKHVSIAPENSLFDECEQYVAVVPDDPVASEIDEVSVMWNRYGQQVSHLNQRVKILEKVAAD